MTNSDVLHSWKDISKYVGRGVRTVQRWEQDLGFPVHRPRGKERSAVMAFASEIDEWLRNTPIENTVAPHVPEAFSRRCTEFHKKSELLIQRARLLISNSQKLQKQIKRAQEFRIAHLKPSDSTSQLSNGENGHTRRVG
jgi:hypothetical protein